ncbi:MAG: hypothetical protein L3J97_04005 [Thermoplasmata archaeon]|nr:hypothetical protein [Thermoplasmata archaeon]
MRAGPGPTRGPFGLPKLDEDLRHSAIATPGKSWREWLFSSFAKVYIGLGLFIGDAIVAAYWLEARNALGLVGSIAPLLYLEFLLYQFLWYEPVPSRSVRRSLAQDAGDDAAVPRMSSAPVFTWIDLVHPFAAGRWSETRQRRLQGLPVDAGTLEGPDPEEFL